MGKIWAVALVGVLSAGCGDEHGEEAAEAFNSAYEELEENKADDNGCSGVLTPDRSGFGNRVALTFDDGPNPATTPRVLDILAAAEIQGTFFINGNRVNDQTRPILQRIIDEGHILANHSYSHQNFTGLSSSGARSQISRTHEVIERYAQPTYFRFPYGASTCSTASMVRDDFGQVVTGWNVDSGDWCYANSNGHCSRSTFRHIPDGFRNDMAGWTMHQVRQKGGGIVLFHDIHEYTTNSLKGIIDTMRSEGYTFTNLDDVSTFPLLNGETLPWVGDLCEGDDDCVFGADYSDTLCELPDSGEGGMCTLECEGTCPDRGTATTFCVSLDEGLSGSCVLKASPTNANCDDFEHLVLETRDRHLGSSGSSARSERVCVPRL